MWHALQTWQCQYLEFVWNIVCLHWQLHKPRKWVWWSYLCVRYLLSIAGEGSSMLFSPWQCRPVLQIQGLARVEHNLQVCPLVAILALLTCTLCTLLFDILVTMFTILDWWFVLELWFMELTYSGAWTNDFIKKMFITPARWI